MKHHVPAPALLIACSLLCGWPKGVSAQAFPGHPLWDIPLDTLTETVSRPLFSPTRRPPEPPPEPPAPPLSEPEPPPPPQDKPLNLTLIGTILEPDGTNKAVLRDINTQTTLIMKSGDVHEGWTLSEIHAREVILKAKGQQTLITFAKPAHTISVEQKPLKN